MTCSKEERGFASAAIAAEVKLRRAEVFCQHRELPSELMTAVAFEVWDDVCKIFGRYEGIMRVLGRIMKSSVYVEATSQQVRVVKR